MSVSVNDKKNKDTCKKNQLDTGGAIQTGQKYFMSNVITLQATALC